MKLLILIFALSPAIGLCGNLNDSPASGEHTFVSGDLTRDYLLHVPKQLQAKAPLVVVMHGYTSSAEKIMAYSGMNQIADEHGFVVVYPQGTVDQRGNHFFNVGYDFHAESKVDDLNFVRDLVEFLSRQLDLDRNRIFATGMSNGADMSYLLACRAADLFRAVAPIAGVMMQETFDTCAPDRALPCLEVHGTKDQVSLYQGDVDNIGGWGPYLDLPSTIAMWVRLNNLSEQTTITLPDRDPGDGSHIEFDRYWSETAHNEVWFYRVIDGGHHWPGGSVEWWKSPSGWWYFRDSNQDINTSRAVWSFFHSMSDPRPGSTQK